MNEQVLIKTIQALSQEISKVIIDKHLLMAELEILKEENAQLKEQISQQNNE